MQRFLGQLRPFRAWGGEPMRDDILWRCILWRCDPGLYQGVRLGLLAVAAASVALSLKLSTYRFGSFDVAPLIDSGWRVLSGQVPGRDFVNTVPASLYLFTALMFRWMGVNWRALSVGAGILFGIYTLLGLRVAGFLRPYLGERRTLYVTAIYAVSQIIPLISINYPWHAWMSQSFAGYAVLTTLVLVLARDGSRWLRGELWVHLAIAWAGLILSKPNVSYPALLLCLAVLLLAGCSARLVCGCGAAALLGSIGLLWTAHVSLLAMLATYVGLANRIVPKMLFLGTLYNISLLEGMAAIPTFAVVAPLLWLVGLLSWRHRHTLLERPVDLLGFGGVLLGLIGFCTNADAKLTDTPMLLLGSVILATTASFPVATLRTRLAWTSAGLLYLAFFAGWTRQRMQTIGMWADEGCGPRVVLQDRFFGTFHDCQAFPNVLHELDDTLAPLPAGSHIFLGTNLEFGYARSRLPSPLHLPLWWHPGTSYPVSKTDAIRGAWKADRFDRAIFVHDDRDNIPAGILEDIARDYVKVPGTQMLDVYRPR